MGIFKMNKISLIIFGLFIVLAVFVTAENEEQSLSAKFSSMRVARDADAGKRRKNVKKEKIRRNKRKNVKKEKKRRNKRKNVKKEKIRRNKRKNVKKKKERR